MNADFTAAEVTPQQASRSRSRYCARRLAPKPGTAWRWVGMDWWGWVILALVIIAVLVVLAVVVQRRRRRGGVIGLSEPRRGDSR